MQTDNFEVMRLHVIHEIAMKLVGDNFADKSDAAIKERFIVAYKTAAEVFDSIPAPSTEDKVVKAFAA